MFCRSLFVPFVQTSRQEKDGTWFDMIGNNRIEMDKMEQELLLAIVLSVILRYTVSDCPFGIFKFFLYMKTEKLSAENK